MKLLITGAAGFIGKHAVKAAMARGWEVDSIDVRAHGPRALDVRLLQRIECDCVLHLAAYASNAGFANNMSENYANNVFGLWNVLRLAQQCGARVVYASSSAVYGAWDECADDEVNAESDSLELPQLVSHYGRSKLINELMAASYPNTLGLRIFNAYGPGDELKRFGSPITQMVSCAATGDPFVCFGDGAQAKDFIHLFDVVEIIMRLIESLATGIVNVGTGVATSFNDLAALIGVPLEYAPVPDPASYQHFTRADLTRLLSIIGPYQFTTIEDGLKLL